MSRLTQLLLYIIVPAMMFFGPESVAQSTGKKDHSTAEGILKRCVSQLKASQALQMDFTIEGNGGNFDGVITTSGNSFAMVIPGIRLWYDGKTQWTLLEEQGSVSISEPTSEELMESNPFVILENYASGYDARRIDGAPTGSKRVLLTPRNSSSAGLKSATLTVEDSNGLPGEVYLLFENGARITAKVKALRQLSKKPGPGAFRFNPKDYPVIETVDLR